MNNNKIKVYEQNPSLSMAIENTKKGVKVFFADNKNSEITIWEKKSENWQDLNLDFSRKEFVDKDKFIKIYIAGLPVLSNLKNSTKLLFQYIFDLISNEIGKDIIYISYKDFLKQVEKNLCYLNFHNQLLAVV